MSLPLEKLQNQNERSFCLLKLCHQGFDIRLAKSRPLNSTLPSGSDLASSARLCIFASVLRVFPMQFQKGIRLSGVSKSLSLNLSFVSRSSCDSNARDSVRIRSLCSSSGASMNLLLSSRLLSQDPREQISRPAALKPSIGGRIRHNTRIPTHKISSNGDQGELDISGEYFNRVRIVLRDSQSCNRERDS